MTGPSIDEVLGTVSPGETRTRGSSALVILGLIGAVALFAGWLGDRTLALVFAAAVSLTLLAPLLARRQVTRIGADGPVRATFVAGRQDRLRIEVWNQGRFTARDLLLQVGIGRASYPTSHIAELRPGERRVLLVPARFPSRGRLDRVPLLIESSYPFGLVRTRRRLVLEVDLVVVPRVGHLGRIARRALRGPEGRSAARHGRDSGHEFHSLRQWREGESLRGVAWRPSTRRGRLLSRELAEQDAPPIHLVLGTWSSTVKRSTRSNPSFERAVSLVATIVEYTLGRGRPLELEIPEHGRIRIGARAPRGELLRVLTALAEVRPLPGDPERALRACSPPGRHWSTIVVLAGRGQVSDGSAIGMTVLDVDAASGVEAFEGMAGVHPLQEAVSST